MLKHINESFKDLLTFNNQKTRNANIVDIVSYIERMVPSMPKESAKNLAFLFYFISIIKDKIPFVVKGGLISQYYLGENYRQIKDLDIITNLDGDLLYQKLLKVLATYQGDVSFKISEYKKIDASKVFYYDLINLKVEVLYQNNHYHDLLIDITLSPIYNKVDHVLYEGPKFIEDSFNFEGVNIEYVMAEKIIAITNELSRPYKHLIDVYSLIYKDIDINLLKKYLNIIITLDNEIRIKNGLEVKDYKYIIDDRKVFTGNYILPCLQAGYNISFSSMKQEVNEWLKNSL